MTEKRLAAASAISMALLLSLTGCFGGFSLGGADDDNDNDSSNSDDSSNDDDNSDDENSDDEDADADEDEDADDDGGDLTEDDFVDTTWYGVDDSYGESWEFTFEEDGTILLVLGGDEFDDDADTWSFRDGELEISIALEYGPAEFTADGIDNVDDDIDLDGEYDGESIPLTIERD